MTLILSKSDIERIVADAADEVLPALIDRIEAGYREMAQGTARQLP